MALIATALLLPALLWADLAAAQSVVTSPSTDRVAVTLYRDPQRDADRPLDLDWLNGFALVSETRTISLPAGESEIRFEGVAGGIIPQSAIVTGLPDGVVEKNQDAYLLSPASLIERSLGRRVHLRRTNLATGQVREHEAIVRSGAEGALVLQTEDGIEALGCSGLPEAVVYDEVPPGLSARPILSVRTRSARPVTATVTLSYLATGFDWQANYVANLSASGDEIELFAWLTLASTDETSFVNASTQAVAGRLNREEHGRRWRIGGAVQLQCWPGETTSDVPLERRTGDDEAIVVTGSRALASMAPPPSPSPVVASMEAQQEELGDLKLYRIPEPVTVAANSQKQVAFLQRPSVEVQFIYRNRLQPNADGRFAQAARILVARNRTEDGLGVPLPAGRMVLFAEGLERPILLGEGSLDDRAVGEAVEVELGPAPGVLSRLVRGGEDRDGGDYTLTVTNDRAQPARFEAELPFRNVSSETRLDRRNGMPLWVVTVPANGSAVLRFRHIPD